MRVYAVILLLGSGLRFRGARFAEPPQSAPAGCSQGKQRCQAALIDIHSAVAYRQIPGAHPGRPLYTRGVGVGSDIAVIGNICVWRRMKLHVEVQESHDTSFLQPAAQLFSCVCGRPQSSPYIRPSVCRGCGCYSSRVTACRYPSLMEFSSPPAANAG